MQNTKDSIQFNFSYYALKLLGKNLYSNSWSAISELVANGLDAQASSVKLFINMVDKEHSTIEILDNGTGMSYDDLANKYVFMGKNKRDNLPIELKNSVMGRKGIGKLAALFLSKKYFIITKTIESGESSWYLDSKNADDSSIPTLERCSIEDANIETNEIWSSYKSGTLIKLTDVDLTGIGYYKLEGLKARLANFFLTDSLRSSIEVCVLNNKTDKIHFEPVKKEIATKNFYLLYTDNESNIRNEINKTVLVGKSSYPEVTEKPREVKILTESDFLNIKGERLLTLKDGITKANVKYEMKGWIGLHTSIENKYASLNDERYLKNEVFNPNQLRLYVRKKLAVENFLDILKNTQAFSNYIEGEISFDLLDDDRFEDIATTNRQSLVTDDERVKLLIEILNPIVGKMIRERVKLGQEIKKEEEAIEAEIERQREEQERIQEEARQKAEQKAEGEKRAREEAEQKKKEEEIKRKQAEEKAKEEEEARKAAENEVKNEKQRSRFIESNLNEDQENVAKRLHMIKININIMHKAIKKMVMQFQRNKFDKDAMWTNLKTFSYHIARASAALKYSPYAKFNTQNESLNDDLFAFIKEYAENVLIDAEDIQISVNNRNKECFIAKFSPQDIVIILENIASNAAKPEHNASLLEIEMYIENDVANLIFRNNGAKLDRNINDPNELFNFGKSYTKLGTGIGLYHVKKIVEENLHGSITINKPESGFELQIRI